MAERRGRRILTVLFVLVAALVAVPALAVGVPVRWAYANWLRRRWERTFGRTGMRVLLVYSRSPHWQRHIEEGWLPRLGTRAVVLDWSERSRWPARDLPVRVFRHWGGDEAFNPLAVLFPAAGRVRTIRFWQPFRDFRHGKPSTLRAAEAELFAFVESLERHAA